ncbi:MAG TPA: sigma 54-interacting transcriptional regulator [Thermoanaerobaculaceae bacterium]|nr:sigma 54-interacting transcriptional regulator [Thermoanaerobaculaceae bacterium]HRS15355.1 sigma 54-interacting transcriptional regulator [Thermoanaerobaculaceae bacterium]
MAYRLVIQTAAGEVRHVLASGDNLVGSAPGCAVRLLEPTVSRRHAILRVGENGLEIEDLGSRNGTLVGGVRLRGTRPLAVGEPLVLGGVSAAVEEVQAGDLEAAVVLGRNGLHDAGAPAPSGGATDAIGSLVAFALEALPALLERLAGGADRDTMARAVGAALFESLPCLEVEILTSGGPAPAVAFTAARSEKSDSGSPVDEHVGGLSVHVRFPGTSQARTYRRIVRAAAQLVACAGPPTPGRRGAGAEPSTPPPLPDPPSVEPAMRRIYTDAARVARGDVGVLITGESGTGKEVLARFVHEASPRRRGPFVALNCAALPRDLLESELFGIEKGVATGVESRPGKFELAHEGTLFLDEIGDMPPEVQAKILRVLQEGSVYRLGAREPRPAQVRVVSATNRDLDALLADGSFRVDLFHRIADWRVHLPPLRERRADIPNLAAHFLAREGDRCGIRPGGISRTALAALQRYGWPGNVRQLEREMARAVLFLADGELLETRHLQPALLAPAGPVGPELKDILADAERRALVRALEAAGGDTGLAAERLGIGRSTLYRRIKELGIEPTSV